MNSTMKALSFWKYGSIDFLKWIEKPIPEPKEGEVVIRVQAASLNQADLYTLKGFGRLSGMGMWNPEGAVLGADMAGEVTSIGDGVTEFKIGDRVFGDLSANGFGAFGEYVSAKAKYLSRVPESITIEEAAAIPMAAVTAHGGLQKGQLRKGQQVMIYGASGGVGTYALQLARYYQAEVTAVCSLDKMDQCRELGADHVLDYKKESMSQFQDRFDLILAVNGYNSIWKYKRALKVDGRYVLVGGAMPQFLQAFLLGGLISGMSTKKMSLFPSVPNRESLEFLAKLLEEKHLKPVIGARYRFGEIGEAFRDLESGHAKGKIVITF